MEDSPFLVVITTNIPDNEYLTPWNQSRRVRTILDVRLKVKRAQSRRLLSIPELASDGGRFSLKTENVCLSATPGVKVELTDSDAATTLYLPFDRRDINSDILISRKAGDIRRAWLVHEIRENVDRFVCRFILS